MTYHNKIIDDFLVNDDMHALCFNGLASIESFNDGSFIVAWSCEHNGISLIYYQKYFADGMPDGPNQIALNNCLRAGQSSPSVTTFKDGSFIIVWQEWDFNSRNIYFQRFNSSGIRFGTSVLVNNDIENNQESPSIASDSLGNFVIVWSNSRAIYYQQYDYSGNTINSNIRVNDSGGYHTDPQITNCGNENFVVIWNDQQSGNVYFQHYDINMNKIATNIIVNEENVTGFTPHPGIASDNKGNFTIVWNDNRNGLLDVYAQRYNYNGEVIGSNFMVNDSSDGAKYMPSITSDKKGNMIIAWGDNRNGNQDIYCQIFDSSGSRIGENLLVGYDENELDQLIPAIAAGVNNDFIIVWQELFRVSGLFCCNIYGQRINLNENLIGSKFRVSDNLGSDGQYVPTISTNNKGNSVISWFDYRNGKSDIYLQRFNSSLIPLDTNILVNDDTSSNDQKYSSVAIDNDDNIIIVWEDYRIGPNIYFQRYDNSGNKIGENTLVSEGTEYSQKPSIAVDDSGNFVIVWYGRASGSFNIYYQKYNKNGQKHGELIQVNEINDVNYDTQYSIVTDKKGNIVIVWEDNHHIYYQRFDNIGNRIGENTKVNDISSGMKRKPDIAIDNSGNFIIVWEDFRNGEPDIYYQYYNNLGIPIGPNNMANESNDNKDYDPDVSCDTDGNFVIIWSSVIDYYQGIANIFGRCFNSNNEVLDSAFCINNSYSDSNYCQSPSVVLSDGKIYSTWQENRQIERYYDIYANVFEFTSYSRINNAIEYEYTLCRNYPNPFNSMTTFKYQLPSNSEIKLCVYDIYGRYLSTLFQGKQKSGIHYYQWDASNLPSGVYFYRIQVDNKYQQVRKCILLK